VRRIGNVLPTVEVHERKSARHPSSLATVSVVLLNSDSRTRVSDGFGTDRARSSRRREAEVTTRTLLRGGCVLTLGAKTPNLPQADVLIEDGVVAEVGPGIRARDAEQVDAADAIVMPGFVDTHRHAWRSLFRNLGESPSSLDAPVTVATLGRDFRPDDVYAATLIALLGAAEAGITTVVDWADLPFDVDLKEAALQAHTDSGLRTVFVHVVGGSSQGGEQDGVAARNLVARLIDTAGPSTTFALGFELGDADADGVSIAWAIAAELDLPIHVHAAPGASGAIARLGQRDMLGGVITVAHCSGLDGADLDTIGATGVSVALTPASEMAGGRGAPPIQELIDRGIRPGLGVDDERVAPGDMFAPMRAMISLQHGALFDRKLAGKAGLPRSMSTRDVIRYATVDGARVAGLGGVTGSLEPGMQADIIVLRTDRPNIFPVNDPVGAVVWGMDTSNLDWVFVGGRALMREGVLQADLGHVRELVAAATRRVGAASGHLVDAVQGGDA
jgi:5-methylthioadenosine/S-adenosylhomocysteine deaminase